MLALRSWVGLSVVIAVVALIAVVDSTPSPGQTSATTVPLAQPQPTVVAQPALVVDPGTAVLTETVGLLAGLQLYQTYLNVGLLADARAEGLYEASELAQLLGSVVTPLEQVEKQLEKVAAVKGLSKEDVAALARMRKIAGLLRTQGKLLQAFWDTGIEDNGKKYETARQAAWKQLDDLLELDPKKGAAPEPKPAEKNP